MITQETMSTLLIAAAMAAFGCGLGLLYFYLLKQTVARFVAGEGWAAPVVMTLCRIAAIGAVFFFAAKLGALPLLATFAGLLVARRLSLGTARRPAL